jgi:hypothetical protein
MSVTEMSVSSLWKIVLYVHTATVIVDPSTTKVRQNKVDLPPVCNNYWKCQDCSKVLKGGYRDGNYLDQ